MYKKTHISDRIKRIKKIITMIHCREYGKNGHYKLIERYKLAVNLLGLASKQFSLNEKRNANRS